MTIVPDFTLWVQLVNFLVLLWLMNILLYKPIRRIMALRNDEIDSLAKAIEEFRVRSEEDKRAIEENMIRVRKDGFMAKEALKADGLEEEKGILQEAGSVVEERISQAKSEIEMKMAEARKALEAQISGFSKDLAEKVLGRSIQ
jgi:F-type H+-transporting ATPase subunit b